MHKIIIKFYTKCPKNYSIFLDIKLLLLTGKTLFIPDHAEGVSSSFKTALREDVTVTAEQNVPKEGPDNIK